MNTRHEFWMEHLEAQKREGITATAYAKQHGLAVNTFLKWRRKLMPTAAATGNHLIKKSTFVALRVAAPIAEPKHHDCIVYLPCGVHIDMATLPAPHWLSELEIALQGVR